MKKLLFGALVTVCVSTSVQAKADTVLHLANTGFGFSCEMFKAHLMTSRTRVWRNQRELMESQARWNAAAYCEKLYVQCDFVEVAWTEINGGCYAQGNYTGTNKL